MPHPRQLQSTHSLCDPVTDRRATQVEPEELQEGKELIHFLHPRYFSQGKSETWHCRCCQLPTHTRGAGREGPDHPEESAGSGHLQPGPLLGVCVSADHQAAAVSSATQPGGVDTGILHLKPDAVPNPLLHQDQGQMLPSTVHRTRQPGSAAAGRLPGVDRAC